MAWKIDGLCVSTERGDARARAYRVAALGNFVELWIGLNCGGNADEIVSYFSPVEAMALAKAFRRCAKRALENG